MLSEGKTGQSISGNFLYCFGTFYVNPGIPYVNLKLLVYKSLTDFRKTFHLLDLYPTVKQLRLNYSIATLGRIWHFSEH